MARDQWQQWVSSPFYLRYYLASAPDPATDLIPRMMNKLAVSPAQRMLVAGCGNGLICLPLAEHGLDVTGTEYSAELVNLASDKEAENLHFYQHDLRLPFWSNYFHFAFVSATAFGHYDTRREHENVIRTIAGSLYPGGYFLLQYPATVYHERNPDPSVTMNIADTSYDIRQSADENYFRTDITVTDPTLTAPIHFVKQKEKFELTELVGMLGSHGLDFVESFGDGNLSPFDPATSATMLILTRKTERVKEDGEKRLYSDGRTTDALT